MKRRNICKAAVLFAVLAVFSVFAAACGKSENGQIGPYYAEYGQTFVLPRFGGETIVRDAAGNDVPVDDGRFIVDSADGYTIEVKISGKKYTGKIIVHTAGKPVITSSFEVGYGTVDTDVALPKVTARAGDRTVAHTGVMKRNGETVDLTGGFHPTKTGEYVYTVSAESGGERTEKTVLFYIEATDGHKQKIASFDKPYGVRQIRRDYGVSAAYSTEIKRPGEAGSTKVTINTAEAEHEAMFALGNFHLKDWSEIPGIRMYIYNDNNLPVTFTLNWSSGGATLMPGVWTQFYMGADALTKLTSSNPDSIFQYFSLESADGVNAEVMAPVTGKGTFSLYFSGLYAGEKEVVDPASLDGMIDRFLALESPDYELKEEIEASYKALSAADKAKVAGYAAFTDKVTDFILSDAAATGETDVIVHADEPFGRYQLIFDKCLVGYSTGIRRDGDSGSTMIQPYGFYGDVKIGYPAFTDITAAEYIEYYIYNPNPKAYTVQLIRNQQVPLPAKEWTEVRIDVAAFTDLSQVPVLAQIYTGNWSQGMEKDGAKFYLSSVRAVGGDIQTGADLYAYIERLSDPTDDQVTAVKRYYSMLSDAEKAEVTNYKPFLKAFYIARDGVDTTAEHRLNYFDSEYGLEQFGTPDKLPVSYSRDMKYGAEQGSLYFTGTQTVADLANGWHIQFRLTEFETDLSAYQSLTFYVRVRNPFDNGRNAVLQDQLTTKETVLTHGAWSKVVVEVRDGREYLFRLRNENDNHGLDNTQYEFWLSAVYGVPKEAEVVTGDDVKAEIETLMADITQVTAERFEAVKADYEGLDSTEQAKVTNYKPFLKAYYAHRDGADTEKAHRVNWFDTEYGKDQISGQNNETIAYTTVKKFGDEKGSTVVTGGSNTYRMFLTLTDAEALDYSLYEYVEFYILYENDENNAVYTTRLRNSEFSEGYQELTYGEWTKIRLKIPAAGLTGSRAFTLERVNPNNGLNDDMYHFYISAVYGVPKTA